MADIDAWPQRISAVTPADVVAAARLVWRPEGLVTAMLTPQAGSR
jgi:zinc protease